MHVAHCQFLKSKAQKEERRRRWHAVPAFNSVIGDLQGLNISFGQQYLIGTRLVSLKQWNPQQLEVGLEHRRSVTKILHHIYVDEACNLLD